MDNEKRKAIRKKCCRCLETKSGACFWIDKRNPDGLSGSCGDCTNKNRKQLRMDSPDARLRYVYNSIKQRCNNKKSIAYKNYGGRGIKCLWNSNDEFISDMLDRYISYCKSVGGRSSRKVSIDRIDNDGDYCKENCRRTNQTTQIRNKRCTRTVEGKPIQEWSDIYNIPYTTIWAKIKRGLSIYEIIDNPNKLYAYGDIGYPNMSLADIARRLDIKVHLLYGVKNRKGEITKEDIVELIKKIP